MKKIKNKKSLVGTIIIIIGLLLVAAALSFTFYNLWDTARAGRASTSVMEKLRPLMEQNAIENGLDPETGEEIAPVPGKSKAKDYKNDPSIEMPTVELNGQKYIGYISFPDLDLELPVNDECTLDKLRDGPCRYHGTAYEPGFVICGHNYTVHFGRINNLREGAKVIFTDVMGNKFVYEVKEYEVVNPDAVQYMISDDWDLSLYTCTIPGTARYTVRCKLVKDSK